MLDWLIVVFGPRRAPAGGRARRASASAASSPSPSSKRLAVDLARELVGRLRTAGERGAGGVAGAASTSSPVGVDVRRATSVNGRAWPASASRASSASTTVERVQELADRVRRVADVEVLRDAAEQMVAGDQQRGARAGAGRRARARGRASRSTCQVPDVGLDRRRRRRGPGRRERAGLAGARRRAGAPPSAAAAPRARRSGSAISIVLSRSSCACTRPVRVHPHLAAGALGDRRRLAAVVDVGVGDDDQPDVLDAVARRSSARSRLAIEPRSCMPVSTSTMPSPAAQRPRVAVRDAGQVERQPQPPHAGQHALAAARPRAVGSACARGRDATVAGDGEEGPPP